MSANIKRSWKSEGWTVDDWFKLSSTVDDLKYITEMFNREIENGKSFELKHVGEFEEQIRNIAERLNRIQKNYF